VRAELPDALGAKHRDQQKPVTGRADTSIGSSAGRIGRSGNDAERAQLEKPPSVDGHRRLLDVSGNSS
jgi:hypothetical protein